jgi:hypothetical protein
MEIENRERIIADINENLVKNLSPEKKQFYDGLEGKKKDYFLFMSEADQATLMKGGLEPRTEELMWMYASTLALKIINNGFGLTERAKLVGKFARISLSLALVAGLSGIFTSTYLKNQKIQELMPVGASVASVREAKLQINSVQNELVKIDNLMTPADFLLSWRSACSPMGDLSDSFYQPNGKPFCKQDGNRTWVGGYVRAQNSYGEQAQPVFLKEEGGAIVNVEFAQGYSNPFKGLEPVPLTSVEREIKAAFNKNNKGEKHE